jgi:dTDP-4-dehydrorhamnose reductase
MKKVLILGGSGMLGSMVTNVFSETEYEITSTVRSQELIDKSKAILPNVNWTFFNIRDFVKDPESSKFFKNFDWIINCIGITKPYCKDDNPDQIENAVIINSLFPNQLAKNFTSVNILQIATDCVFSGKKGNYLENSEHDPTDVYGKTKSLGESKYSNLFNLRCSIIGPEFDRKAFLIEWLLSQPIDGQVNGFTNHDWNGVSTLHFAKLCLGIIKNNLQPKNLQHIIPSGRVNKFGLLNILTKHFCRPDIKVNPFVATEKIDRTLLTNDYDHNEKLWKYAGYKTIPTVDEMMKEAADYNYLFKRG